MSQRIAKKIETRREWEANLTPFKNPLLYLRSVLTWQRPIDFGVLLVLVTIGLWAVYSYEVTVVTLLSVITVVWVVATWGMERFNVFVPWNNILPPQYNNPIAEYYSEAVGLLVNIRCDWADAWEDLMRFRTVNETRFVIQVAVVGSLLAWIGSYISGSTLIITTLYFLLVLPGVLANSIPQRGFVIVEPYIKVYLDKAIDIKNLVVAKVNERISSATNKSTATTTVVHETVTATTTTTAEDDDHVKAE